MALLVCPDVRPSVEIVLLFSPLLYAAALSMLALAAGSGVAARFVHPNEDAGASTLWMALALPLGLGLLGQTLFLCGIAGLFGAGALAVVAGLALTAGWRSLAMDSIRARGALGAGLARRGKSRIALVAVAAIAFAGPAWLALYPPVAWDDTVYHLPLARSLAEHGRYLLVENLRAPVFPLLAETLYAPALLWGRASTSHGLSLVATFATALLLLVWGRDRFAGPRRPEGAALWMVAPAAIWIGQPIVVYYAGSAYIEPLLTLFATASMLAFERWRRDRGSAWLLAAGAFAGWAAATKYLALYLVAALALAAACEAGRGFRWRALAGFAGAAALAGAPWYLLIWSFTGNPLFPFLSHLFGAGAWSGAEAVAHNGVDSGWVQQATAVVRLGWDLVVERSRVNAQPPASPLVILALPLLLYLGWRRRWARVWVGILGGFVLAFLALPRDARYLMPYSPLLSLLLVAALRDLAESAGLRLPRLRFSSSLAAVAIVGLGLASGPAYAVWRTSVCGPPPVAATAIDAFLARRVPLYRALLYRRAQGWDQVPVYALHGERLHEFGGSALLGDWLGPYRFQLVLPLLEQPEALAGKLRELGARQLLLPHAQVAPEVVAGLVASERFRELYRDPEGVLFALVAPDDD
jgi:hypothetical protein